MALSKRYRFTKSKQLDTSYRRTAFLEDIRANNRLNSTVQGRPDVDELFQNEPTILLFNVFSRYGSQAVEEAIVVTTVLLDVEIRKMTACFKKTVLEFLGTQQDRAKVQKPETQLD